MRPERGSLPMAGLAGCLTTAGMLLAVALFLGAMVWINGSGPSYAARQGSVALTTVEEGNWPCPVTGEWLRYEGSHTPEELEGLTGTPVADIRRIRVDSGATYRFLIRTDEELYFNQVVSQGVRLWINGREILSETGEKLTRAQSGSLAQYANGSGMYSVAVCLDGPPQKAYGYWGLVLGSRRQIAFQMNVQLLLDLSLVGMYLMMLIACIALYAQKTSERYLLLLAFVTVASLIRWLPQIRFEPLIRQGAAGFLYSDLFVFARFFLFRQFIGDAAWKRLWPAAGLTALCWLAAYGAGRIVGMSVFISGYLLVEGAAIASGLLCRRPGNGVLAAGWCVNLSIELFYLLLNAGLLPQGRIDICIRPMPHGRLLCLVAFFIAIFGIFARKFRVADDLSERLDMRVREQTEALRESNRQLAHAKAVKQEFMADVAHDLRNPLFAMGGYLDLLGKAMPERTKLQERYLQRMDGKLQDLTQMVNDLLYMARLEDGRIEFHFTRFSLRELLKGAAADARAKGQDRKICVEACAGCAPEYITGDSFRLREALDNLLANALRYSPDGGCIEVWAQEEEGWIRICVQDHGEGMSQKALAGIFKRYSAGGERGENGLGLAICHEIVKRHKGTMEIDSAPGAGTCVAVRLPIRL